MTTTVHRGNDDDNLYWTHFDGTRWSPDTRFGSQKSSHGPALAGFGGKLYCAYKGAGRNNNLWWCTFNGAGWSGDQVFGTHRTDSNPALAVYGNARYSVYTGVGTTARYYAQFIGSNG
ncbi:hypothetical protein ACFXDI_40265 [Streptomyces mirabilis]|uniref:hypothetical protein n=1 Tax=Streptomyces mirabilis TaxID=68239 RepID=UPI0036AAA3AB